MMKSIYKYVFKYIYKIFLKKSKNVEGIVNQSYSEEKEMNKDVDYNEEIYETKSVNANKKPPYTKNQQIFSIKNSYIKLSNREKTIKKLNKAKKDHKSGNKDLCSIILKYFMKQKNMLSNCLMIMLNLYLNLILKQHKEQESRY